MSDWEIETIENGGNEFLGLTIANNAGQSFFMEEPEAIYLGHDDFYYNDDGDFIKIDYQLIAFVDLTNPQQIQYEWNAFKGFVSVDNNAPSNAIVTIIDINSGMRFASKKSKGSLGSTLVPLEPINSRIS